MNEYGLIIIIILAVAASIAGWLIDPNEINSVGSKERRKNTKNRNAKATENNTRLINCPSCSFTLKIPFPPPEGSGSCPECKSKFRLVLDNHSNISIYLIREDKTNDPGKIEINCIDDAFRILGIPPTENKSEIKNAYRKRIGEYHPDKVSLLGDELRKLAEAKSKEINLAYSYLLNNGVIE